MFSFFKRKRPMQAVPEWASFFDEKGYNRFITLVERYFRGKSARFEFQNGVVEHALTGNDTTRLGLVNLAQICQQSPDKEWKKLINRQFTQLRQSELFTDQFEKKAHDFQYARQFLGVRAYHRDYTSNLKEESLIIRPLTDDIDLMLVFDFPHSVMNVKPEQSILWNLSEDELMQVGQDNIKANYRNEISEQSLEDTAFIMVTGDHFFVPNIVLELEIHPGLLGTYGSVVCIPHRHGALIFPIENLAVVEAINRLAPLTHYMFDQGPGSLSKQVYWYKEGQFETIPCTISDTTVNIQPSDRFVDMLNGLEKL